MTGPDGSSERAHLLATSPRARRLPRRREGRRLPRRPRGRGGTRQPSRDDRARTSPTWTRRGSRPSMPDSPGCRDRLDFRRPWTAGTDSRDGDSAGEEAARLLARSGSPRSNASSAGTGIANGQAPLHGVLGWPQRPGTFSPGARITWQKLLAAALAAVAARHLASAPDARGASGSSGTSARADLKGDIASTARGRRHRRDPGPRQQGQPALERRLLGHASASSIRRATGLDRARRHEDEHRQGLRGARRRAATSSAWRRRRVPRASISLSVKPSGRRRYSTGGVDAATFECDAGRELDQRQGRPLPLGRHADDHVVPAPDATESSPPRSRLRASSPKPAGHRRARPRRLPAEPTGSGAFAVTLKRKTPKIPLTDASTSRTPRRRRLRSGGVKDYFDRAVRAVPRMAASYSGVRAYAKDSSDACGPEACEERPARRRRDLDMLSQ